MEIERKFLVRSLPDNLDSYPHRVIEQGYLATSPTVRVRRYGNDFILTVKEHIATPGTIVNREEEFALTAESYDRLLSKCDGIILSKTRYRIPLHDSLVAELDIFSGAHLGLMIVEVEFPDVESALAFEPPCWFGDDVSHKPEYRNSYLASHKSK